jgi:hypothetical protein
MGGTQVCEAVSLQLALFRHAATSDLVPLCAPKRMLATASEFLGSLRKGTSARPGGPPKGFCRPALAAERCSMKHTTSPLGVRQTVNKINPPGPYFATRRLSRKGGCGNGVRSPHPSRRGPTGERLSPSGFLHAARPNSFIDKPPYANSQNAHRSDPRLPHSHYPTRAMSEITPLADMWWTSQNRR